jgi:hypothetical protein
MSPILVIVAVFIVLLAGGVVYDLRRRRLDAGRRGIGLSAETARGIADSHGEASGANQGQHGGGGF